MKKGFPVALLGYPPDRTPETFTGLIETQANRARFAEFYFENRVDPVVRKSRNIFDLIIKYNDEVKPDVPFWPKPYSCRQLNKRLKVEFAARQDALEAEGKTVIRANPIFGKELPKKSAVPIDRSLEQRTESLADRLIDSAENELSYASDDDDPEIGLKRKAHALGVFAYISRHVHKKQDLAIKKSAAKVGEASFLMDLLGQAASGKLTGEQLMQLESALQNDSSSEQIGESNL
jgi:hypothetical protein